jgi:hypothetical protein
MAEKRIKVPFPPPSGPMVDASEVQVRESNERWSEVTLEDGTVLRIKPNVMSAVRVDGQFDPEGNPMYGIKAAHTVTIVSSPEHLRKPRQGSTFKN